MSEDFTKLPENLLKPEDDGSTNHLLGRNIPNIILPSTKDSFFDLSNIYMIGWMYIDKQTIKKEFV